MLISGYTFDYDDGNLGFSEQSCVTGHASPPACAWIVPWIMMRTTSLVVRVCTEGLCASSELHRSTAAESVIIDG